MKHFKEKITIKRVIKIFALIIGLMSGFIAIYTFLFQEKRIQVDYEIVSSTNVLDVNADVSKLDITYDDNSLKTSNKSLRLINLKIRNTGTECISLPSYDIKDPLGVKITNGKIVEKPELVGESNDYIKKNLYISIDSNNNIFFNEIILDPGDFYIVKLLILHSNNESPDLQPIGKIAGVKAFTVISSAQIAEEKSFWSITFGGNIFSHILRLFSYTLVALSLIVLMLYVLQILERQLIILKRRNIIRNYKRSNKYQIKKEDNIIFDRFIKEDYTTLIYFNILLSDEIILNELYQQTIIQANNNEEISKEKTNKMEYVLPKDFLNGLIKDGYVIKDRDKLVINFALKNTLSMFSEYLESKRYIIQKVSENNKHAFPETIINGIIIHTAKYYHENDSIDVTLKINILILQNKFEFTITNDLMGEDPSVGNKKELYIDYTKNGKRRTITRSEGSVIKID